MWVLALLFWKRPRLAQNIVIGWLLLMGAQLVIIAPGQLYLRAVAPESPAIYPVAPHWMLLGGVAGPLMLVAATYLLAARRRPAAGSGAQEGAQVAKNRAARTAA